MVKLMQMTNGQYLVTIPRQVVWALSAKKGDDIYFNVNLKKGIIEMSKDAQETRR